MRTLRFAIFAFTLPFGAALLGSGCSSVREIAQGAVDQFAATDAQAPQREATRFEVPEDALFARDRQLEQTMFELGRKIARGFSPKVRLTVQVGRREDADWLLGAIDKGIASTGWQRSAVMVSPMIRLSNQYPTIIVEEGHRS